MSNLLGQVADLINSVVLIISYIRTFVFLLVYFCRLTISAAVKGKLLALEIPKRSFGLIFVIALNPSGICSRHWMNGWNFTSISRCDLWLNVRRGILD